MAREIYTLMGGSSPIRAGTEAQAVALEKNLNATEGDREFRCFTSMRYWHPRARQVVRDVKNFAPDEIVLLPLFPQYSTTTVGTSFDEWARVAQNAELDIPTHICCCYPLEEGLIEAHATEIEKVINQKTAGVPFRLLLSAHSLPQKQSMPEILMSGRWVKPPTR